MSLKRKQKWDFRFLALAEHIAQWSKDPSTQVGAVIVDSNNRIISVGYNGFPQKIKDLPKRLNNRELKYEITLHGEENALIFGGERVKGGRLYSWPFMPCSLCASKMIQAGIVEVVAPRSNNPRWIKRFKLAQELFAEAKVRVKLIKS